MSAVETEVFIKETYYEEKVIEWKISDFFSIPQNRIFESRTFSVADSLLAFRLEKIAPRLPQFEILHVWGEKDLDTGLWEYPLRFHFRLRRVDGSVVKIGRGYLHRGSFRVFCYKFPDGMEQQGGVASSNGIAVMCTFKLVSTPSDHSDSLKKPELKTLIKLDTLSESFKNFMENKESCDVTLRVQDKEYKAHRAVLMARSSVFAAMFLHESFEKQTGVVNIPDCASESFGEFLKFLYTGKCEEPLPMCALTLYKTSHKYAVQELQIFCMEYLKRNICVENICDVVILADKYEESDLLNAVQDFFNENLIKILKTPQWECLVKNNYCLSNNLLIKMSSKVKLVD